MRTARPPEGRIPNCEARRYSIQRVPTLAKIALWSAGAAVLAATFAAYLNPQFAFDLATRAWACF